METTFCLRLAFGLVAVLPLLPSAIVPPRFFRVQFLVALALLAGAAFFLRDFAGPVFWITCALGSACCCAGSVVWHLDNAPGGRVMIWLTPPVLLACLILGRMAAQSDDVAWWQVADDLASACVLGSATSAMLMGHSYLIAPTMSMSPLLRLLAALGVSLALRIGVACVALWLWTAQPMSGSPETELLVWLPVRWVLGLLGPLALGWMAWETARIRSTQSATGILYVVVIVCFLGELTSQLLVAKTGLLL
jgi:hypothetical protein